MSDDVVEAIRAVLVRVAQSGELVTYAELLARLDADTRRQAETQLAPLLRTISIGEDDEGRGLLTAIVVNERDGLPGVGWFRLAADRGRDLHAREAAWRDEVRRIHEIWSRNSPQVTGPAADQ